MIPRGTSEAAPAGSGSHAVIRVRKHHKLAARYSISGLIDDVVASLRAALG